MINYDKFLYFVRLQLDTGDYDAHIPLLAELTKGWDRDDAVCLGFQYMAYYNEASAWLVHHDPGVPPDYPIEQQRRNLYGGRIWNHLDDLSTRAPLHAWLLRAENWCQLLSMVGSVWGNGRWATYTSAELANCLGGLGIEPDRFEVATSSGPAGGLVDLGLPPTELYAWDVLNRLRSDGLELSVSQCESLLCDWHGMCKGTFYAGRNIDRQQGRIVKVQAMTNGSNPLTPVWNGRMRVFPIQSLGEHSGWVGIDKDRLSVYQREGRVLAPWEER